MKSPTPSPDERRITIINYRDLYLEG